MRTIFSTADVPRAEAFDYWMEVACANIANHEVEPLDRRAFSAWMQAESLADLPIARWSSAPHNARAGSNDTDDLLLLFHTRTEQVQFAGHSIEMNSNGLVLFDTREAYVARAPEPIKAIGLRIPRDVLARRIRIARGIVNRPVSRSASADAALLEAFVRDLVRVGPSNLSRAAGTLVREQLLDLTGVVFGAADGVTPKLGAASHLATLRLRAAIDRDPRDSRESIAAAAGISVRHANRLLALEGTSILRLLTERRLGQCREAIENQRHRKIGDIAFAYGFRDPSHFGRAFKSRFGLTPSDYRAAFDSTGQQSPRRPSDED